MAIELVDADVQAATVKTGTDTFTLAAGEKVRVQKYVGGETVDVMANQTVPPGKVWSVCVNVGITETDADEE